MCTMGRCPRYLTLLWTSNVTGPQEDFMKRDIHSEEAFQAIDRNNDGFISKGELKLAKKEVAIKDVEKCINDFDINSDGKLSLKEYEASVTAKGESLKKYVDGTKSGMKSAAKKPSGKK